MQSSGPNLFHEGSISICQSGLFHICFLAHIDAHSLRSLPKREIVNCIETGGKILYDLDKDRDRWSS